MKCSAHFQIRCCFLLSCLILQYKFSSLSLPLSLPPFLSFFHSWVLLLRTCPIKHFYWLLCLLKPPTRQPDPNIWIRGRKTLNYKDFFLNNSKMLVHLNEFSLNRLMWSFLVSRNHGRWGFWNIILMSDW